MVEEPGEVQRWTARRRAALVTSIIRGENSIQEAARPPWAKGSFLSVLCSMPPGAMLLGRNCLRRNLDELIGPRMARQPGCIRDRRQSGIKDGVENRSKSIDRC